MKLIEPSVELIEQEPGIEGIYKQIERCSRICYKSEDKITEDSAKKFVDMLIKNEHGAMLEHGTVYLKFKNDLMWHIADYRDNYSIINSGNFSDYYITTNFRVLQENNWLDDLQYLCEPTEYHEKRYTLKFTTSIGITRELVRHRHMSFANESTRYCNYSKNGFNNEITVVIPSWCKGLYSGNSYDMTTAKMCGESENIKPLEQRFIMSNCFAEEIYMEYIQDDLKPQEAREMLPLCTKSEIIMTGFESDWKDFFKLRCDKAAHPDMQIIANKAKELLKF